jgi:hypothetical protein
MKTGFLTAATAAMVVCALPALAETQQLYASGLWSAYGGTAVDNRAVCGITTVGPDGRRIAVQQFAGEAGLDLQLDKPSWSIPDNTPIDLSVQIDRQPVQPAKATGSGTRVAVQLTFDQSVPFMRSVRYGSVLRVYFPGGNEPAWTGGLAGTSNVIDAFNTCRSQLGPITPTQPFQPHPGSPPPGPTQPFSPPPPAATSAPDAPASTPTPPPTRP